MPTGVHQMIEFGENPDKLTAVSSLSVSSLFRMGIFFCRRDPNSLVIATDIRLLLCYGSVEMKG